MLVVLKTSFDDHLQEDRLDLEGAMSAAPAKIVASVFRILISVLPACAYTCCSVYCTVYVD